MRSSRSRPLVILTLLLAVFSTAPAAPPAAEEEPARPAKLAQARYQAALEQYELIWTYFQQNRTDSFQVYYWSRLVLDSGREMGETPVMVAILPWDRWNAISARRSTLDTPSP